MSQEELGPILSSWLKEENRPPSDPVTSVRTAINGATKTRQLRRRWWLPPFMHGSPGRPSRPQETDHSTVHQSSPTRAANHHAPIIMGRTQTMLSPAKAITAGAIVLAIGGVMLFAQPSGEQGRGRPGAATDAPRTAPVEVTGSIVCGPAVRVGTSDLTVAQLADGRMTVAKKRGDAWRQTATMSDPRLTGTFYTSEDTDEYRVPGGGGVSISSYTRRIENADGAWQGSDTYAYLSDGSITALSTVLIGEGAFEGLRVIWEELWEQETATPYCSAEVRGVIIDGDVPPMAEPFLGRSPAASGGPLGPRSTG